MVRPQLDSLTQVDPRGRRRDAVEIDDEKHVPARWRDIAVVDDLCLKMAYARPPERNVDESLIRIPRMSGRHRPDELSPFDVFSLRRVDFQRSAVMHLLCRVLDVRSMTTEKIRRMVQL